MKWESFIDLAELEKRFQEKPIVAFTNSTIFILDLCISQLPESMSPDYK